jgi:diadenosine tetraphosphatase ApaH/serine/threonine PP2A family protein phosphatase
MIQLHRDPLAQRLDGDARPVVIRSSMRAPRTGAVRRRFGGWLVSVGERLASESTANLKRASDCG